MSERIIQLSAEHFEPLITFLDLVFGEHHPHEFRHLLPAVYGPSEEQMRCNYAIMRDGRIVANVGLFPIDLQVAGISLKVAGIGGVSVHPETRGQGLMCQLMDFVLAEIHRQHFQLSYLGGHRQRYGYWGWERGGSELQFEVDAGNIRHSSVDTDHCQIRLHEISDDHETIEALHSLHDCQVIYCRRPAESFYRFLLGWGRRPLVARGLDDSVLGYFTTSHDSERITEIVATSDDMAVAIMRDWVRRQNRRLQFVLAPGTALLARRLGQFASTAYVAESGNWQIFDWPGVVHALLKVHHAQHDLPRGVVVIRIDDADVVLRLIVDDDGASCRPTDLAPDWTSDAGTALRVLFGPLDPLDVVALPTAAVALRSWCPLPLGLSYLDHV